MARRAARQNRTQQNPRCKGTSVRSSRNFKGVVAFGALTVAVLVVAGYFLWPAVRSDGAASPGAVTVQVSMGGFNPSRLETRAGEPVTLRLVNKDNRFHADGGGWHQFAIEELGVDMKVPPLKTEEFTFTPIESGTFEFYCDVCCGGRENPYMRGNLIVEG